MSFNVTSVKSSEHNGRLFNFIKMEYNRHYYKAHVYENGDVQVSKTAPYDNADYYWATGSAITGKFKIVLKTKVQNTINIGTTVENGFTASENMEDMSKILQDIVVRLDELNSSIESKMSHN